MKPRRTNWINAGFTRTEIARRSTHDITDGYLGQLDLPVQPGHLKMVRTVNANWPRLVDPWVMAHGPVTFRLMIPADAQVGTVVEWAFVPDETYDERLYTVIVEVSETSLTLIKIGFGAEAALRAASTGNSLRAVLKN
jgi:hypothetical protein